MTKRKKKNTQNYEEYSELYDAWMEYSKEMTERIRDITQDRTQEYEELYNMWNEYTKEMTKQVGRYSPKDGPSFHQMQKAMSDYSDEIGNRFADILGKGNGPYKELYQLWTEYSKKMGAHLSELMNDGIKEQKDLYEIWMDSFGIKDKAQKQGFPMDFGDFNQFFLDMWEKSQNMYPPTYTNQADVGKHIKDLTDLWTNAYNKMVMEFIKSSTFAQLNGNMLDSNLNLISQNDEMVNQYLKTLGFPTKDNIDELYLKLHEMDRKLSKISRDIKTRKSSKRK